MSILKIKLKGIYITFVGNAECFWSENSGDKRIAYRGKECYLSTRIYFIGQENGMVYKYLMSIIYLLFTFYILLMLPQQMDWFFFSCMFGKYLLNRRINNTSTRCLQV